MHTEPPLRRDHPTNTAREQIMEYLGSETGISNVKLHQQPHEFSIVHPLSIHTNGGINSGPASVAVECSGCGNYTTLAAREKPIENLFFQPRTMSRIQTVEQHRDAWSV